MSLDFKVIWVTLLFLLLIASYKAVIQNSVKYLDEYGDATPFLMKDGFVDVGCDSTYQYWSRFGKEKENMKNAPASSSKMFKINAVRDLYCQGLTYPLYEHIIGETNKFLCQYSGCQSPCTVHKKDGIYMCPMFIRSQETCTGGNSWCKLGAHNYDVFYKDYWNFGYQAVCGENDIIHPKNESQTGTLCDYDYQPTRMPVSLVSENNCTNKTVVKLEPGKLIHVSQTVFAEKSQPFRLSVNSTVSQVINVTVLDLANTTTASKNEILSDRFNMEDEYKMDLTSMAVRDAPYKVIIDTENGDSRIWFYLRLLDTSKLIKVVKLVLGGNIVVGCKVSKWKDITNVDYVDGNKLQLWNVTNSNDPQLFTNAYVTPDIPTDFQCRVDVFTPEVCFPYNQKGQVKTVVSDIEKVTSDDFETTTVELETTTGATNNTTSTESTSPIINSTTPAEKQVTTVKLALSEKIDKGDDLNDTDKNVLKRICQGLLTIAGCSDCLVDVLPIKKSKIPLEIFGIGARRQRRQTQTSVDDLIKKYFKSFPLDVNLKSGKKAKVVGETPDEENDPVDHTITIAICVTVIIVAILILIGLIVWMKHLKSKKKNEEEKQNQDVVVFPEEPEEGVFEMASGTCSDGPVLERNVVSNVPPAPKSDLHGGTTLGSTSSTSEADQKAVITKSKTKQNKTGIHKIQRRTITVNDSDPNQEPPTREKTRPESTGNGTSVGSVDRDSPEAKPEPSGSATMSSSEVGEKRRERPPPAAPSQSQQQTDGPTRFANKEMSNSAQVKPSGKMMTKRCMDHADKTANAAGADSKTMN